MDYDTNNFYIWKKPVFHPHRPRKVTTKKRVSFSDTEGELVCDTLAATGSDSSSDNSPIIDHTPNINTTALNQGGRGRNKKRRKKRGKRGEKEKDIKESNVNRYQLRGWKQL